MGCCVSTGKTSNSSSKPPHQRHSGLGVAQTSRSAHSHAKLDTVGNRAPPPVDEEFVKEVLSETPTPRPPPSLPPRAPIGSPVEKLTEKPCSSEKEVHIHPAEGISEISNICSFSESPSTTTITEKLDDYEEIRQRICRSPAKLRKNRSFSEDWGQRKEKLVGKSPTRKSDQSPSRRNGGGAGIVKLVHSRDMGMGQGQGQGVVRRSLRSEQRQPNKNENSCRRSRSPATTRTGCVTSRTAVGRSPSGRRSGTSPRREATTVRKTTGKETVQQEGKWRTTNESLENPLVSLECFIFL